MYDVLHESSPQPDLCVHGSVAVRGDHGHRPFPVASAAPGSPVTGAGWSFRVSSVPAGVNSGGELAFDATRRALFITDNDFVMSTKGGTDVSFDPHVVRPKVTVFSIDKRRPVRSIDFTPQPWGMMPVSNAPIIPTRRYPTASRSTPNGVSWWSATHMPTASRSSA